MTHFTVYLSSTHREFYSSQLRKPACQPAPGLELRLVADELDHPSVEGAPPLGIRDLAVVVGVEALDVRVDELSPRCLVRGRGVSCAAHVHRGHDLAEVEQPVVVGVVRIERGARVGFIVRLGSK